MVVTSSRSHVAKSYRDKVVHSFLVSAVLDVILESRNDGDGDKYDELDVDLGSLASIISKTRRQFVETGVSGGNSMAKSRLQPVVVLVVCLRIIEHVIVVFSGLVITQNLVGVRQPLEHRLIASLLTEKD